MSFPETNLVPLHHVPRKLVASSEFLTQKGEELADDWFYIWKDSTLLMALFFSDQHCMQLVREGVTDKLLTLLQQQEVVPTVQHAVFSALRNLSIPSTYWSCVPCIDFVLLDLEWFLQGTKVCLFMVGKVLSSDLQYNAFRSLSTA